MLSLQLTAVPNLLYLLTKYKELTHHSNRIDYWQHRLNDGSNISAIRFTASI